QAAATLASMMPGRFMLGLGTGELLNEHVTGARWPRPAIRVAMLSEAIEIIRMLLGGGWHSFDGQFYTVEDAKLFTLPSELPPILVAASSLSTARLAAESGDGLISTAPDKELVDAFASAGGKRMPRYGQLAVGYAESEDAGLQQLLKLWPNTGVSGVMTQ